LAAAELAEADLAEGHHPPEAEADLAEAGLADEAELAEAEADVALAVKAEEEEKKEVELAFSDEQQNAEILARDETWDLSQSCVVERGTQPDSSEP